MKGGATSEKGEHKVSISNMQIDGARQMAPVELKVKARRIRRYQRWVGDPKARGAEWGALFRNLR
eukprot:4285923-Pyramimonas_sp.AAC.1